MRVNSFDWIRFYEKLGGGVMLEAMKQIVRKEYDYVIQHCGLTKLVVRGTFLAACCVAEFVAVPIP